ncbi:hypothetical protein B0A56_01455 [Flavobacterium columnare NBRC 100251 = ATCC 23463]|nr:hypothetical protein B0A56_01455 [Flavobacterium columnare NBRC 100251 = ATCC 23463]
MAYIEARIQEYLDQLDQNDSQENAAVIKNIQQKIEPLKPKFHIRKKFNQVTNQKISDFSILGFSIISNSTILL